MLAKLKRYIKSMLGLTLPDKLQTNVNTLHLGSESEGWVICPDNLNSNSIVYSFGVGKDISFDLEIIKRFGLTVNAFDPTPEILRWLGTQLLPAEFVVHPIGLASLDGQSNLYPSADPENYNHSLANTESCLKPIRVEVRKLGTIMQMMGNVKHIDLLKMDIEGAEYSVVRDIIDSQLKIEQIVLEFHHNKLAGLRDMDTIKAINILNDSGYKIFYISPKKREYSFIYTKC